MRRWTFTIDGVPRTKERPRLGQSGRGKSGGQHHHTSQRTADYEAVVGAAAMEAGVLVGDGECDIVIEIWIMPSTASEGQDRRRSRQRKDPDNIAKVVLDGLLKAGKGALRDDGLDHIRNLLVVRAGYSRHERVTVTIIEVTEREQPFVGFSQGKPEAAR